jgi:hypothetical protein
MKMKICEISKIRAINSPSSGEFIRWLAIKI